jgi:beta-galactosidase
MTFKSGFCDENSAVRPTRMPGPLRKATGFSYQEFSNLEHSIELRGDPFHVGRNNRVQYWAEFLKPQHAKPLAFYQDTFLGRYPAITLNRFGTGTLTYEGTWLSAELQRAVIKQVLKRARIPLPDIVLPSAVKVHHTLENSGHMLHFYFNYSSHTQTIHYTYPAGTNLLAGSSVLSDQVLTLPPWGLALIEQH